MKGWAVFDARPKEQHISHTFLSTGQVPDTKQIEQNPVFISIFGAFRTNLSICSDLDVKVSFLDEDLGAERFCKQIVKIFLFPTQPKL